MLFGKYFCGLEEKGQEVCRRLNTMSIITRTEKKCWDRSVIWGMLKNPAYKGQAAFGKTKVGTTYQTTKTFL